MPAPSTFQLHEKDFFARIAHGDEEAFEEIFYHYVPRIQPFIKKITRSELITEEVVQDVFVSLWKNREKLANVNNYTGYIFTIATNKTYNFLKVKAREAKRLQELAMTEKDFTNNTVETIDLNQSRDLINHLVNQLTPQKKLIYKLTREEGLSHDEIAERLSISKNTIKNHLVETLKYLRENLHHGVSISIINVLIKIYSES
jgi:RNA polymerase sigma-70 factor (family 1)